MIVRAAPSAVRQFPGMLSAPLNRYSPLWYPADSTIRPDHVLASRRLFPQLYRSHGQPFTRRGSSSRWLAIPAPAIRLFDQAAFAQRFHPAMNLPLRQTERTRDGVPYTLAALGCHSMSFEHLAYSSQNIGINHLTVPFPI